MTYRLDGEQRVLNVDEDEIVARSFSRCGRCRPSARRARSCQRHLAGLEQLLHRIRNGCHVCSPVEFARIEAIALNCIGVFPIITDSLCACASLRPRTAWLMGGLALAAVAANAAAADYPVKPIRMLTGFTAGGGSDIAARSISIKLSETFGQSLVVDNRPGRPAPSPGNAAKAPPDGYTVMMLAVAQLVPNAFEDKLPTTSCATSPVSAMSPAIRT